MNDLAHTHQALSVREAVELGASSLIAYGKIFHQRTFRQESPEFHYVIDKALMAPSRYNIFEVFRGGAKTSLLRVFTAQRIAYSVSRTILFTSVSQGHSIITLRWLKRQFKYNALWRDTFQLRQGSKWTDEWIEFEHGIDEVPITILAAGITGQIRGFNLDDFRPDLIVFDDVLNEENTATREQRKKTNELLLGALINSLAPASEAPMAKAVGLQTPFHREDPVEQLMKDPQWHGLKFSCFTPEGESAWPERFPLETLKQEKASYILRNQYRLWMREWECQIVSGEDKCFNVTNLQQYTVLPEWMRVVIAIDPASSDEKLADDHAIVALGFAASEVYVLDYKLSKGTMPDKALADLFSLILLYNPLKIVIESISYQRVLKWLVEQEMQRRRIYVPIDGVQDRRRKADRITQALAGLIAFRHLHIRPSMTELVTQLDDYDPMVKDQPDDLLDAIAMGITALNPAQRAATGREIEGDWVESAEEYRPALYGGAP